MIVSVEQLIDVELGGTKAAALLLGVDMRVVSNWKMRGRVPAEYSLILSEQCADRIDPGVFGIKAKPTEASA